MSRTIPHSIRFLLFGILLLTAVTVKAQTTAEPPNGSGTEADPYQISSLENLAWLCTTSDAWDKYFLQTADIDASGTQFWDDSDNNGDGQPYNDLNDGNDSGNNEGFRPIGNQTTFFTGNYSGNGLRILNLNIRRINTANVGFIGYIRNVNSKISGLSMLGAYVEGGGDTGLMVGKAISTVIENCHANGTVNGSTFVGGLVGYTYSAQVKNCWAQVKATGTGYNVGGLIGSNSSTSVSNCYTTGDVKGGYNVGGLVGFNDNGSIAKSYSIGKVTGTSPLGGFIGRENNGSVSNSFWDTQTSGQQNSAGGTAKNTTEMKIESTYVNWDFGTVWKLDGINNDGYPYLRSQNFNAQVQTRAVSAKAATSVTANGSLANSGIPAADIRGFVWAVTENPTVSDNLVAADGPITLGDFSTVLTGLEEDTVYYVRAFAGNEQGDLVYGEQVSFSTDVTPPVPELIGLPDFINGPFTLNLVFDEPVTRLVPNPIEIASAAEGRGTAILGETLTETEGLNYHIEVTPTVEGELVFFNEASGMAEDLAGNLSLPLQQVSVIYDAHTESAIVHSPMANTATNGSIVLDFTLPEDALEGSVVLFLKESEVENFIILEFTDDIAAKGDYRLVLDPAELDADPRITAQGDNSLKNGTVYDLFLGYSDTRFNAPAVTEVSHILYDRTAPILESVTLGSDNIKSSAHARAGNEVYVDLTANENIENIIVQMNAVVRTPVNIEGNVWRATLPIDENSIGGDLFFEIYVADAAGNGTFIEKTTDQSSVLVDTQVPALHIKNPPTSVKDKFTLQLVFDEPVRDLVPDPIKVNTDTEGNPMARLGTLVEVVEGLVYTVEVIPLIPGELRFFNENSGLASDTAGNLCTPLEAISVSYDISDLDGDGVSDTIDQCPDSPEGASVNASGCEAVNIANDNYKVEVIGASCIASDNGSIRVSATNMSYGYGVAITGQPEFILDASNSYSRDFNDLPVGLYDVCFSVLGKEGSEQCFEARVTEPLPLQAFSTFDKTDNTLNLSLSGSETFNITLNGKTVEHTGKQVSIPLKAGYNSIKVDTGLDCQGIFEKEVFVTEKVLYHPNPTEGPVTLYVPGTDAEVRLAISDLQGTSIKSVDYELGGSREITVDLGNLANGTYIIYLEGKTVRQTFKIIKR